jgi:hypothetical protein
MTVDDACGGVREQENRMTSHLEWLKIGRATRGTPGGFWNGRVRWFAVAILGGTVLLQSGCQSGSSSNCRLFSPCGFLGRTTSRIFNRDRGCCGSTAASGGLVEYGAPATVVTPAPGAIPSYPPGGVMGTSPSNVSPPIIDNPSSLEPAPKAKSVPAPNGAGPTSSTGSGARSTSYLARRGAAPMATRSARNPMNMGGAPSASTTRTTPSSAQPRSTEPSGSAGEGLLDHLPPLDLPGDVTNSASSPPTPPAAPSGAKAPAAPSVDDSARRDPAGAEFGVNLTVAPEPVPESAPAPGIGIARFAPVDLKLAGGSLPSEAGLSWLSEKGYRTLVDLREAPEVPPSFIASVTKRGLRYVALPTNLKTIDAEHVARFNFEIGTTEARPLFFFDSDGSCAGSLWYIRRLTVDQVDPQLARREAEELGLVDQTGWLATNRYVEKRKSELANPAAARSATSGEATKTDSKDHAASVDRDGGDELPASIAVAAGDAPAPSVPASGLKEAKRLDPARTVDAGKTAQESESRPTREVLTWRPMAAVLLTGLSVPLVYWTRTAVPAAISRARASLPAPGPRPESLPCESGE